MLSAAQQYVIERGITDVCEAKVLDPGTEQRIREIWDTILSTREGTRKFLDDLCSEADRQIAAPGKNRCFLTPRIIAENTRLALRAAEQIELAYRQDEKPPTIFRLAKLLKVEVSQIRFAVAQAFVHPDSSYRQLIALCDPHKKEKKKKGRVELKDKQGVSPAIEWVVCRGRFPDNTEAEELMGCTSAQLKRRVRTALIDDIQSVVTRFNDKGFGVNDVVLNRHSYYYREYGIRAYYLFFDENLDAFFKKIDCAPETEADLKAAFKPEWHFNLCEHFAQSDSSLKGRMGWISVQDALITDLEGVTDKNRAIELVETHLGITVPPHLYGRFSLEHLKTILRFWNQHRVHFAPPFSWFTYAEKPYVVLEPYKKLLHASEDLALPFKTLARLFHLKLTPEELLRRVKLFESYGLPPEYFIPYLTVLGKDDRVRLKYIMRIRGAICAEERMNQMSGQRPANRPPERILAAPPDRHAAIHWLRAHRYNYEDFAYARWNYATPEACALSARLLDEVGLRMSRYNFRGMSAVDVLNMRHIYAERLRKKTAASARYEDFIRERGLSRHRPSAYFLKKKSAGTLPGIIEELERQIGRPLFTYENLKHKFVKWDWLERGARAFGVHLARSERRRFREKQLIELEERYGFRADNLPMSFARRRPFGMWQHFEFLRSVDIDHKEKGFYAYTFPVVRDRAFNYLRSHCPHDDLTSSQRLFLERYKTGDDLADKWGWRNAHELCLFIGEDELSAISRLLKKPRTALATRCSWQKTLKERAAQKKDVLDELFSTDASFARMDALLAKFTPAQLLEHFAVFDELKRPVNTNLLLKEPEVIRNALAA